MTDQASISSITPSLTVGVPFPIVPVIIAAILSIIVIR